MQRWIASVLAVTLVALAPGTGSYQALAQVAARGGASAPATRVTAGGIGTAAPAAPALSAPLSGPSLSLTLPAPAAVTPRLSTVRTAAAAAAAVASPTAAPSARASAAKAEPAAQRGAVRETVGRMAVEAAPRIESASQGSPAQARSAGVALETILSGRTPAKDDADLVPAGRPLPATRPGLLKSAPSLSETPINEVGSPGTLSPRRTNPVVRGLRRSFEAARKALGRFVFAGVLLAFTAAAPLGFEPHQYQGWLPQALAQAVQVPGPQAAPQGAAAGSAAVQPAAAVVEQSLVAVEAAVTGQGVTVGEAMTLTITLRNLSGRDLEVSSVRSALEEALPWTLELRGQDDGAAVKLAAGETKVLTFTVVPFDAGKIVLEDATLVIPTADPEKPVLVKVPAAAFEVASVLTPDWKEKGFKDLAELRRGESPSLLWLLAIPAALLTLLGAERLLSSRRRGREPIVHNGPALDAAQARLKRLEAGAAAMDAREFHGEALLLVERLLTDLRGLPRRERATAQLFKEAAGKYTNGQLSVARGVVDAAEAAVYGNRGDSEETRRRTLAALRSLIEDLSEKPQAPAPAKGFAAAGLLGGVSLSFANPWALLLIVPVTAWALWKWRSAKAEAWSTTAPVPAKTTGWRARFRWLTTALRATTLALIMLTMLGPSIGVKRSETYVPSTDTMVAGDISGSMSGERLEGLKRAVKDYLIEQRRGTQNRVGIVTFSDTPYLAVSLTTDYDALIARIKETQTEGSTAVGKALLSSISHFLELNIMQLDASDPRVAEMRKMVLDEDLAGALAYAKRHPGLLDSVLQPEKSKIVVLFTDGESNTGITPADAAKIAKSLGVKVYTVGIQISGGGETALKEVAAITGGLYFRAEDADGMRNALLDIARLEKSPALVRSQVAVQDLTTYLALLALLSLTLQVGLSSTAFRRLPALVLAGAIGLSGIQAPAPTPAPAPAAQVQAERGLIERLPLSGVPQAMAEGNALYLQGRYADAVKRYAQALERHPDVPELYFNLGNAYLRLGDVERAARAYAKFLELEKDPKAASEAIYNLGNGALMQKDAEKALELYREALRRDPSNFSAKWNLEALQRLMEEQQQQQQDGQQQQKQKKGKKGQKQKGQQQGQQQQGQQGDQQGDQEGDQEGDQQGDQQGKPGDKPGKPGERSAQDAKPTPGEREQGADALIQEQGKAEAEGKEGQRGAVPRKGTGVWGFSLAGLGAAAAGFQAPLWLGIALVAVPVVAALTLWAVKKNIAAARALAPREAPKDLKSWEGRTRFWAKFAMLLSAVLGLAIAAGDPVFGSKDTRLNFGGKDVVVAADVSASTLYAEDGRGERIESELAEFVTRMQGTDRIGLVVFAGAARTASPLSADYGTFEFKVGRLEREARGLSAGSDLGAAVEQAVKVYAGAKKVGERQRILIVVSDGEIFDKELAKAIDAARKAGVTIYAVGVGNPEGTRIAVPKADGSGVDYLVDAKTGQPALSRLNEGPLRELAAATGGHYFRSSQKGSMSDILSKVAELSKGEESDQIKTPRGISFLFLTPALLLLLLEGLLPAVPLLKARKKETKLHGGLLLGLAIPLSVWPQVLPFAALAAVLGGLILYDLATRGAITRAARAWLTRKAPAESLIKDLFALFDKPGEGRERWRETDHAEVRSFVEGWRAASPASRRHLARRAAEGELWREKLTAALLAEAAWPSKKDSEEVTAAVFDALEKARRSSLLPLDPVIAGVLARRSELAWLDHPAVLRPLSRLAALGLDQEKPESRRLLESLAGEADAGVALAAREALPESPAKLRPSRLRRAGRTAAMVFLAAMVGLTGFSGLKTAEFHKERAAAAQTALSIFYGEDLYIFGDAYMDERIPREVLPVVKEWHATGKAAAADLERALEVLRSSPDPKADNILEALFKRADLLPLSDSGETLLLKTLVERDNEAVWRFLNEYMAANAENPAGTKRLIKMIAIAGESGSETVFQNVFHFLKSPNPEVRSAAAQSLRQSLSAPERAADFAKRLSDVAKKHENDPLINMWVAFFALDRLAAPDANTVDLGPIDALLSTAIANARKADAARLGLLAQVKPGEEDKLPPPALVQVFGLMERALERAQSQGVNADPLALAARRQADLAAKGLIEEGRKHFPALKERLQKDGVMLPDPAPQSYEPEYDDYHGHGYYGGYGYVNPNAVYRDRYTLAQLDVLAKAVAEARDAAGDKLTPEQREFSDRALRSLQALRSAAEKAGMPAGGTLAEAAADDVNTVMMDGYSKLPGSTFLGELRAAKLAPDAKIGNDKSRSYYQAYSAEEILRLRAFLLELLARGETRQDGKSFPLNWSQKSYLADAVTKLDAALKKHYPAAVKDIPSDPAAAPLLALSAAAQAKDAAGVRKALSELAAVYAAEPVKDLVLARFKAAYPDKAVGFDDAVRLQVLEFWLARLAEPDGAKLDAGGVKEVLGKVAPTMMQAVPEGTKGYALLAQALAKAGPSAPAALVEFARGQVKAGAERALGGAKDKLSAESYAALRKSLREARLLDEDLDVRKLVKLSHLRALRDGLAAAKAPAWTTATAKSLLELAAAAGLPDGGTPAELAADAVNEALHKGHSPFPGSTWYERLRQDGLAPAGSSTDWETALPLSYTPAQLRAVHGYLSKLLASGRSWDYNGKPADMSPAQARALAEMLEAVDAAMARHYPAEPGFAASLGRLVEAAAKGDAAARAGASARLAQAGSAAEALAILEGAAERSASSPEAQKLVAALVAEALSGRNGAALAEKDEVVSLIEKVGERLGARENEAWNLLASALERAPNPILKAFVLKAVNQRAGALADELEKAEGAEARFLESGVFLKRGYQAKAREAFTQRHLGAIAAEAARQKADAAAKLLPSLSRAAVQGGMATGDAPADIAGERMGDIVYAGHMLFPGTRFVEELRAAKVLATPPSGRTSYDSDEDVPLSWSKADLQKFRDFVAGVLASGQGWDYSSGRRDLSADEKAWLEKTLRQVDSLLANFDQLAPAKKLHGFAFGGLALGAAPVAASLGLPLLALGLAGLIAWGAWLAWKSYRTEAAPAEPRLGPSASVLARYKRLDVAAKKLASSLSAGKFRTRLVGPSGLTFAELAAYNGEDRKAVNWKASAKGDTLLVNKYEQEKDMPLMLLIDLSASGEFGAAGSRKREVIEDAAALLALTAARRGIRVGALLFTDRVEAFIPPAGGQRHAWELVRQVMTSEPQGTGTDLKLGLEFAAGRFRSRAMVVLLSDLLGEGWEQALSGAAQRHDLRALRVVDPAETKALPGAGLLRMADAESGAASWVDTGSPAYREAASQAVKGRERRVAAALAAARTDAITLYTDEDAVDVLTQEFLAKRPGRK